jgi:hypothetical protein
MDAILGVGTAAAAAPVGLGLALADGLGVGLSERTVRWVSEGVGWLVVVNLWGRWLLGLDWPGVSLSIGAWQAHFGGRLSGPGAVFALWGSVGTLIALRAARDYLHREPGYARFQAGLLVFLGALLLVALSDDLVGAFLGWELLGVSSALLVGWRAGRAEAGLSGLGAWLYNRVGDAGFMAALAAGWAASHTTSLSALSARAPSLLPSAVLGSGLAIAAVAKSGLPPFSAWISRAVEGPTPSSALYYAAVMVHAGPVLLLRLGDSHLARAAAQPWLLCAGGAAVVWGTWVAAATSDVKRSIVHAGVAQGGIIAIEIALGWDTLALAHALAHGTLRGWQLLRAPSWRDLVADRAASPWVPPLARALGVDPHRAAEGLGLDALVRRTVVAPLLGASRSWARMDAEIVDAPSDLLRVRVGGHLPPVEAVLDRAAALADRLEARVFHAALFEGVPALAHRVGGALGRVDDALRLPWVAPALVLSVLALALGGVQ